MCLAQRFVGWKLSTVHSAFLFFIIISSFSLHGLMATTYYVSATGNDLAAGTTPASAWASIARVNTANLVPGDVILFEGNQTFAGNLTFGGTECGTPASPIRISSYGGGRATLNAGSSSHGIYVYDCAGFEIENLNITGSGRATNDFHGILFYTDVATVTLTRHAYIRIDSVEVSGFNKGGISIVGNELTTDNGYEDIQITHSVVHDCGDHGIEVVARLLTGTSNYPCANIYVGHCSVYDNPGEIGKTTKHTGNGIVIGNTEGVTIEHSMAWNNGAENVTTTGGPVGIWLWDCKDGIIQHCESYNNHTGPLSGKDGGGFDLDGGCNNCIIQYCYSHDNDGAGYLLAEFDDARDMVNNQIRYCISENDGRKNDYAGFYVWRSSAPTAGLLDDTRIYNNTVYISANTGTTPAAFKSISANITDMKVSNNVFIVADGVRLVDKSHGAGTDIEFIGNLYYSLNSSYSYREGANTYNSLVNWRAGEGQEMMGATPQGLETDPMLLNPGGGGTVGDPSQLINLDAYKAQLNSPLEDAGQNLNTLYGINTGLQDFFATSIPINIVHDIGAYEGLGVPLSADVRTLTVRRLGRHEVQLSWKRTADVQPQKIEIQRRTVNSPFSSLEVVEGHEHAYIDRTASGSGFFYRLVFIYEDGRKAYSSVVEIAAIGSLPYLDVFPNPARQKIDIRLQDEGVFATRVEIMDLKGQLHYNGQHTTNHMGAFSLSMDKKIAAGIYLLRLYHKGTTFERKLLIIP